MQRRRWEVAVGAVLAVAVGAAGWWIALAKDDPRPAAAGPTAKDLGLRPSLAPFTVSLSSVPTRAELDFGTHLSLAAEATADQPLSRIELWDGDRLVGVQASVEEDGRTRLRAEFDWVAVSPGQHLLGARAVAIDGTKSWSRNLPVVVGLSTTTATGAPVAVAVEAGRSAAETAQQLGVDPASLVLDPDGTTAADAPEQPVGPAVQVLPPPSQGGTPAGPPVTVDDPTLTTTPDTTTPDTTTPDTTTPDTTPDTTTPDTTPDTTAPPTTTTTVPDTTAPATTTTVPATTTAPPLPDTTTPAQPTSFTSFGAMQLIPVSQYLALFPVPDPTPTFTLTLDGCAVTITRTGDTSGPASVHRSSTGFSYLLDIADLKGGAASFVDQQLMPGVYQYLVSAVVDGAEFQSDPRTIVVPSSCAEQSGWSGGFSIINGVLTVPEKGSGYYVYMGPTTTEQYTGYGWRRIPQDDRAFITAASTKVVITPLIPGFGSYPTMHAELWRSDGQGGAAKVADATWTSVGGRYPVDVLGGGLTVDLTLTSGSRTVVLKKNQTVDFDWEAAFAVNRVVWQVTAKPLPRSNTSLQPPGLLATGTSITPNGYAGFGQFWFDTGPIPRQSPPEPPASGGSGGTGSGVLGSLGTSAVQPASLPAKDGVPAYAKPWGPDQPIFDPVGASNASVEEVLGQVDSAAGVALYVRGIPMIDEQIIGMATPTVVVVMPNQAAVGPLTFQSFTLDAGQVPNPAWQACGVVNVPWDEPGWVPPADVPPGELAALQSVYQVDGSYCRFDSPPSEMSWDEELWALVQATGQQFVGFYDAAAAAYNSLGAYVGEIVADLNPICDALSGSAAETCRDYSKTIAAVAVKAALQFLGLPPSLPTSSALIATARATLEADISAAAAEWLKAAGVPCDDWAQDPGDYDTAMKAAAELGVDLSKPKVGENGKVDVCREIAHELLRRAIDKGQAAFNAQISQAMGGPGQTVPIPGFEISPHPAGRWNPQVVTIVAVPTEPGLDPDYVCNARVHAYWTVFHEGYVEVPLRRQPDGTWAGTGQFNTYPDAGSDLETLYENMDYFTDFKPNFAAEARAGNDMCFGDAFLDASDTLTPHAPDPQPG